MPATAIEPMSLPAGLVRMGRENGVTVERLQAESHIQEAQSAWPGDTENRWDKWLREAAACVSLSSRIADLTVPDAVELAQNGLIVVGGYDRMSGLTMLLDGDGSSVTVAVGELKETQTLSQSELAERLSTTADAEGRIRWVVIDHPELTNVNVARESGIRPTRRLFQLLRPEWSDIWIILVFAFVAGVLSLTTPIAVEALVNTVAFGRLLQPVVILAALLFGFLAFAAAMRAVQIYVVEFIQRRLFARVAADLAFRLPRMEAEGAGAAYAPELANRFLDVVTLQKVTAQLLTDGINIVLATIVGMTVLAFYHPWLLGFDILLLILVVAGLTTLGRGAIPAAIKESKLKYSLTAWFEDVMRCPNGFKASGAAEFASDRASGLTTQYLAYRQSHFRVLYRQILFVLGLQAVAGTVLLGGGGWLVIQGQLSLGQLVAAELIVATILSSIAKLGKHLEGFYDAVAAVDKLGILFDLPVERLDGVLNLPMGDAVRVRLNGVKHARGGSALKSGLDASIDPGEKVALLGSSGSGKTTLLGILYGGEQPSAGHVEIEHTDPRDLRPDVLRDHVGFAGEPELFQGSIAENVHLNRTGVSTKDARTALFAVGILDKVLQLPDGLDTAVNASGGVLSRSQQYLLMLARALAGNPRLLLIDGTLDSLSDECLHTVREALADESLNATVIVATGRRDVAKLFDRTISLDSQSSAAGSNGGA
ncbi:MAG: ATP-binding cassette domain-containing protein [Planctomycetota bacterium]